MLLRLIFIAIVGWFLSRLVKRMLAGPPAGESREGPDPAGSFDEMVQDPVCGTYVPVRDAFQREIGGRVYHFCSERCAGRFHDGDHRSGR